MNTSIYELMKELVMALSRYVRTDTAQEFTETEKSVARNNIDASAVIETVDVTEVSSDGDKIYKLTLSLTDGTKKEAEFAAPQGEQGIQGEKGDPGEDGQDGYTPIKGTDYFTEADKTEMVEAVAQEIEELPAVTADDENKILQVVDGVWVKVAVADSSIKTYVDDYINSALEGEY